MEKDMETGHRGHGERTRGDAGRGREDHGALTKNPARAFFRAFGPVSALRSCSRGELGDAGAPAARGGQAREPAVHGGARALRDDRERRRQRWQHAAALGGTVRAPAVAGCMTRRTDENGRRGRSGTCTPPEAASWTAPSSCWNATLPWTSRCVQEANGAVQAGTEPLCAVNAWLGGQNKLGDTPLHSAAWAGQLDTVMLLLEVGPWSPCPHVQPRGTAQLMQRSWNPLQARTSTFGIGTA